MVANNPCIPVANSDGAKGIMPSHTKFAGSAAQRLLVAMFATMTLMCAHASSLAAEQVKQQQRTFTDPESAVRSLIEALRAEDRKALLEVLGTRAQKLLSSGDAVADKRARAAFLEDYTQASKILREGDAKAVLAIGKDEWPLPIPIVKRGDAWSFDTKAGEQEILNRRIGRNELAAIQAVLAYVDAQHEYASKDRDRDGVRAYATKIRSSPGKKDGLYWPVKEGEEASPLGPLAARAAAEGYGGQKEEQGKLPAYHGYHYRIINGQGKDAPGGAYSYMARGKMIGGFALVAWPASYRNSGVMTFIVNHDGVVYEKDLGPDTAAAAQKITKFNPDQSWKRL
jgi:hypothetical protein